MTQQLLHDPYDTGGCAPLSKPELLGGRGSAAALASGVASGLCSGLASGVGALGATGRIAPALVVVTLLGPLGAAAALAAALVAALLGTGAFGVVAAVCVDFGCDFFVCAGAGCAGS